MTKHYNTDINNIFQDTFKFKSEFPEAEVLPFITPTREIVMPTTFVKGGLATNASNSVSLFTTPTDKDFYVTGYSLSMIKDATSTSTATHITLKLFGETVYLAYVPTITLTPQTAQIAMSLVRPLKVDRGTSINLTNTTAVANHHSFATILGYLE